MPKSQAIAFFEEISKNQQLAQEVEKVVGGKFSDEAKAKELLSLAKNHGFNFTKEEAASAQGALKTSLSPEEMLEVSGGKLNLKSSLMAAAMLLGLGVGGATMSNIEASAMKRGGAREHFGFSDSSGKSGKIDPQQTLPSLNTFLYGYSQGQSEQNVNRSQPQPATTGTANSTQNETPPSNDQGSAQSDSQQTTRRTTHSRPRTASGEERHAPRQLNEYEKHAKEAAERFDDIAGCTDKFLRAVRGQAGNGYLPNSAWPAVPQFEQTGDGKQNCRYCNAELTTGQSGGDPFCENPECIFSWTFRKNSDKKQTSQRPVDSNACARWALLPALILDSRYTRINSTGNRGNGAARTFPIETPAEAWAVWHLLDGHNNGWVDVERMMQTHGVDATTIDRVKKLLEGSYDNLVQGNEHLRTIGLGSEVQQLVEDHNNGWQNLIGAMVERGYGSEEVKQAFTMMINSYYMLTAEQLADTHYDPSQIHRDPTAALAEIESAHQRFEEARRQAKVAVQQAIEKLQRGEKLSLEEANKIAPMLKCGNCGNTGADAHQIGGSVYFQCPKCHKGISNKPADLLAMLQEGAPENAPMKRANAEQDEQHLQFEIQPMQINQGEGPTYEIKFHWDAAPQMSMQGMNQFNHGQQMRMQQNMFAMEMDDEEDYVDRDFYDRDKNPRKLKEQRPPEVKERREEKAQPENYANPEPVFRYPGMMGYSDPQQQHFQHPNQMMNPNGFEFNFGAQGMNQFNLGQQMRMQNHDDLENTFIEPYQLQTGDPNNFTFNMGLSHAPIHHHLTVYQMDAPQQSVNVQTQNMQQMNGMPQNNRFAQNQQQILQRNTNQMNNQPQNAQVDQNQQIMTYQPGLNFDPTQELQPPSAQQNGTQPQQNLIQQPILNLDLHHDPVGNYVNALNTDTQELAQYTGMLLELISTGQAANVAQIGEVEIAAKTVVNRVFARELQDQANQIILNTLGADNRYLGAAQAFTDQLKRFNNVLDMIGKQWK